ncbi:MAG: TrkH family potassium uptake protein [Clostridia bacterium]|nr:TrkH family potassium uptake protein [Clostridia bacterium]
MNRRIILYFTGRLICIEALLMILPLIVSAIYKEDCYIAFLIVITIAFSLGMFLTWVSRPRDKTIYAREGFIIVALSWVVFSAIGALPFVISGAIPSYVDAFFETVSGFTTTGASILTNIDELYQGSYKGILFWRSFTHWIGGMGILVFVVAMTSSVSDRSIHILKAEMPGPTMGKLVPRLRDTAKLLYLIYIGLTLILIALLWAGDMNLYDSIVHAVGTAGTGGFGIKGDSLKSYSAYSQWVIGIFMFLFGLNFNVYYFTLIRRFKDLKHCAEAWIYLAIASVSIIAVTLNIMPLFDNSFGEALRQGVFQVGTVMSTTGYATADFNTWPQLSKAILFVLMFSGACANSTAGGLKISRVILLIKSIRVQLKKLIHPRSVNTVKFEGKNLDNDTLVATTNYFSLYMICIIAIFIAISLDGVAEAAIIAGEGNIIETNFTAVVACFNNIGPGLGMVGPAGGFSFYSPVSKIILSVAMLLGRLEIFPILLTLAPNTWRKHK